MEFLVEQSIQNDKLENVYHYVTNLESWGYLKGKANERLGTLKKHPHYDTLHVYGQVEGSTIKVIQAYKKGAQGNKFKKKVKCGK